MIIAIEGHDAVGKATQSKLLAERLKGTCITVPDYSTETGAAILGNLKKEWCAQGNLRDDEAETIKLNPLVFQSLMIMNRYEMVPRINEALKSGPVVLDRWTQSSTVYGVCSGLDREWCERVQSSLLKADVNILIDVPIDEGFKRRPERRDRHETDKPFLEKVRREYLHMWGSPQMTLATGVRHIKTKAGWYVINGLGTVEQVEVRIMDVLQDGWKP